MKIRTKANLHSEILEVYGLYEISGNIYYYVRPDKYEGLLVMKNDDIEMVDNTITGFIFEYNEQGVFIRSKIIEDKLFLERLSECDPEAFTEFLKRVGTQHNHI